jgi:ATP-dependent DNA helicase DinG
MKARREAQQADVVVVNHHLFFADVALKDTGVAELLPTANTIIFDEAHQLPDTATLFFGETVSTSQLMELCRDVLAEGLTHARDGADWGAQVASVEKAVRDLRLSLPVEGAKLAYTQIAQSSTFFPALEHMKAMLSHLTEVLAAQAERAETLEQCRVRASEISLTLGRWHPSASHASDQADVLWVEAFSQSVQLHRTPLSIAPIFNKQREGVPRAWIFTSATLAAKNDFSHFTSQMGLELATAKSWPSPFDYARQALLYVPTDLPDPNSPAYTEAVVDAALPVIEAAGGRAFLLCTTLRAVRRAGERLRDLVAERELAWPLLIQGELGRTELLERFRSAGNAVLVGSQSFWEGVDVRGEALSVVIIDKLPFAPPDDPVLAARIAEMERRGQNGFMHHQLPEAIIALKQGAGRLIRDEHDRGVLMICDPRLISKPYGRRIWQSLPPFARTRDLKQVESFLLGPPC